MKLIELICSVPPDVGDAIVLAAAVVCAVAAGALALLGVI